MRVLIVGAGPTGAALSYLLARRGIEVVLLEREEDFGRVFRGEALMPSGVDALAQMGLGEAFERLPQRRVERLELFMEGRRVLRAAWPETSGPENAVRAVSQPALLEMLVAAARRHPGFELRLGAAVRDAGVLPDGVELEVRTAAGNETLSGDVVVGTDGRASIVRARSGLAVERLPFPADVAWFSAPLPPDQEDDPRFQSHSRGGQTVVLYPSWDGRLRLGLHLSAQEAAGKPSELKAPLLDKLCRVVGEPYGPFFRERADELSDPVVLKVLFGRCPQWWAPRTLLLGDAVHPMSPVRSQGINLALRDALVAANHLVPALESGDAGAFEEAARRIQAEREPEITLAQQLQLRSAQPPPPVRSPLLRATVLPILKKTGVIKRMMLKSEQPLRHGSVPVRLEV